MDLEADTGKTHQHEKAGGLRDGESEDRAVSAHGPGLLGE